MQRGHRQAVLDHGYVEYVDSMGTDETVVEAARMSTGRGFEGWDPHRRCRRCGTRDDGLELTVKEEIRIQQCYPHDWEERPGDARLLERLYSHRHMTPFEMCELHLEVQAPIMVFREWHRHRTMSYNEFSARYSPMPDLHYLPPLGRFQAQSTTNRQGSAAPFEPGVAEEMRAEFAREQRQVFENYEVVLADGLAKEVARLNCPVSRYSKMRVKTDLRNWLGFLELRLAPGAQQEIREYAGAVAEVVEALWPRTWALFEEHTLYAVRLSCSEVRALAKLELPSEPGDHERVHGDAQRVWAKLREAAGK